MTTTRHWQDVYTSRQADHVSWYRPHLDRSLALLDALAPPPGTHVLDAGAGASTFVDDLLDRGLERVTVVDLARAALDITRARLGSRASRVSFVVGDVSEPLVADVSVDIWHDRAVMHFLTDPARRDAYVDRIASALRPGGHVILATFALDGPERCSGLPVTRYAAAGLLDVLGPRFEHVRSERETHETPDARTQTFTYLVARRSPC